MQKQPKRVVSKAQHRFFSDALRRIEAGGESPIKDMTADDLRFALDGVDYAVLPERAGGRSVKRVQSKPQPRPQLAPQPSPPACTHENARIIDLDGYLDKHPQHPLNRDPAVRRAITGGLMVQVDPEDLPHLLLRNKLAVKAALKADPRFDRSQVWSYMEAQAFLAALATSVKTLDEAAREMAYCSACAKGVPREEQLLMRRWPQRAVLTPELRDAER
jgi:hypothetical protein